MPEPTQDAQDVRRWWLTLENGKVSRSVDIAVSGREVLMNNSPELLQALLAARFDDAIRRLREEFLKNA